ncbi:I78 family peptidase inhibitor [Roseinatronobacter bogoriensis]|uniref:Peptidase inhibitor I78 n=1 Tax=Roseinatronobacter bogoriensis subsp. barguzinensis TaxID=441209 RepID=A0A2K8KF43_9RHOB|nr:MULTISPECIES: I78 family peptidase inhibitor [Rhodobaca]ATX66365.1 hypothetical protein BG454_11520 [Rhodobaca barguzinensis]MBB4207501.1 hypothetical protein [Rhodobaca bogoriensis DSM 18756]TDW40192.1 peptidase inhibitor I78 family protein [Rhodobaca barguzinensis]TDY70656.1 peptidase inhibitor I78 family protein [Rhodobaca bogoriensis DSM 18756]
MIRVIAIGALLLAACQTQQAADDPMSGTCIADDIQSYIGAPLTDLDEESLPQPNRIIGPGMAVTMDWNPTRLNVEHDEDRIITRIYCG